MPLASSSLQKSGNHVEKEGRVREIWAPCSQLREDVGVLNFTRKWSTAGRSEPSSLESVSLRTSGHSWESQDYLLKKKCKGKWRLERWSKGDSLSLDADDPTAIHAVHLVPPNYSGVDVHKARRPGVWAQRTQRVSIHFHYSKCGGKMFRISPKRVTCLVQQKAPEGCNIKRRKANGKN